MSNSSDYPGNAGEKAGNQSSEPPDGQAEKASYRVANASSGQLDTAPAGTPTNTPTNTPGENRPAAAIHQAAEKQAENKAHTLESNAASPADPQVQSQVDQLIDYVNRQLRGTAAGQIGASLIRQMVQCLVDPRRATRLSLVDALGKVGKPALPFLLEGLKHHPEPVVRRACCNALQQIGDPAAVPALAEVLQKEVDASVKSAAAGALSTVGLPALEAVRSLLTTSETSESCKGYAASVMVSMAAAGSLVAKQLYRWMSDPSPAMRAAVVSAIAQIEQIKRQPPSQRPPQQSPETVRGSHEETDKARSPVDRRPSTKPDAPPSEPSQHALIMLTEALSDHSPAVRIEAATSLARLNYQKAYQPLIACLKDVNGEVRKTAALALARLGNPDAIEAISALQRDMEVAVQRAAVTAVAQLEALKQRS